MDDLMNKLTINILVLSNKEKMRQMMIPTRMSLI